MLKTNTGIETSYKLSDIEINSFSASSGTVVLNLPDEQGIQLVASNIVAGQTTQSAVVPIQRVAPITEGQALYTIALSEQMTGFDPATGAQVTLMETSTHCFS